MIEVVVIGERGFSYGNANGPMGDPNDKGPLKGQARSTVRLYDKGSILEIADEDYIDFDKLNRERNMAKGQQIEVTYRKTGKVSAAVAPAPVVDLEAIKAIVRAEMKAEAEAAALKPAGRK